MDCTRAFGWERDTEYGSRCFLVRNGRGRGALQTTNYEPALS